MPANKLINVIQDVFVPAGQSESILHGLVSKGVPVKPTIVQFSTVTNAYVSYVTDTHVHLFNSSDAGQSFSVYVEHKHSLLAKDDENVPTFQPSYPQYQQTLGQRQVKTDNLELQSVTGAILKQSRIQKLRVGPVQGTVAHAAFYDFPALTAQGAEDPLNLTLTLGQKAFITSSARAFRISCTGTGTPAEIDLWFSYQHNDQNYYLYNQRLQIPAGGVENIILPSFIFLNSGTYNNFRFRLRADGLNTGKTLTYYVEQLQMTIDVIG